MNRGQPSDGRALEPRFHARVLRLGKPPAPWIWAIYQRGREEPHRQSPQFYRSAEEAWAAGRAMLNRLEPTRNGTGSGG